MKRKMLFVTIIQIACVVGFSSSSTAANVADVKTKGALFPSSYSFVKNGRLLPDWSSNLTADTEDIDLSNLGIEKLDRSTFEKFRALNELDLSSNSVTSAKNIVAAFQDIIPSSLNLSHNYLQGSFNEHRDTDRRSWWSPMSVPFNSKFFWSIDLSHNFLTGIVMEFDVAHLNLSNNLFQCIDAIQLHSSYPKEIYVGSLDLSHNFINCQVPFFISSIDTLDMSYNELTGLNKELLQGLERLTVLNLSHNKIRYIHPRAFEENSALLKLDLGFNKIRSIYKWVWFPTRSLRYIDLSSNQLGHLEWEAVWRPYGDQIDVDISNNTNVQCSQNGRFDFVFHDNENHL